MKLLMSLGIFYPSQVGGPGNTLYWLGKELVKKGVDITVVTSDLGVPEDFAPRDIWYGLDGINIKYCRVKNVNNSFKLLWQTLKEVPKSEMIMLSSVFYKPNFFVGLTALFFGKKIIWSPRGELLVPRGKIKKSYLKIVKLFFGQKVLFHATSEEEKASVQKFFGNDTKVFVIPNYMELPQKAQKASDENYFLYVGRVMPIKALENLIEGAALAKNFLDSNYKLYIAGRNDGDYYHKLMALIKKNKLENKVIFKGMVTGSEKEVLYAGARFTFLVSHSENFGNVIIESLAQGTPAITSKGTPWKCLQETGSGYWIDNTPESISEIINFVMDLSENEYLKMRNNARELCVKEFDVATNVEKWLNVLK